MTPIGLGVVMKKQEIKRKEMKRRKILSILSWGAALQALVGGQLMAAELSQLPPELYREIGLHLPFSSAARFSEVNRTSRGFSSAYVKLLGKEINLSFVSSQLNPIPSLDSLEFYFNPTQGIFRGILAIKISADQLNVPFLSKLPQSIEKLGIDGILSNPTD